MTLNWVEVMAGTVHDVRTHVRRGATNAQLLERELGADIPADTHGHLDAVLESLKDLDSLAKRLGVLGQAAAYTRAALWNDPQQLDTILLAVQLEKEAALKEAGGALEKVVEADRPVPAKLQIALSELVQNAIVFREPSRPLKICIRAYVQPTGRLAIHVLDNGSGWPQDQKERMFQPFFRLCADKPGFGLGLTIAKLYVEAAGGTITASPQPEGSEFRIELPSHEGEPRTK